MKKKLLFGVVALLLVLGCACASVVVKTNKQNRVLNTMVEALADEEHNYWFAENYLYEDGRMCCKDAFMRLCTIGFFCE